MNVIIVFSIILVVTFVITFMSSRRFGLLVLALVAGHLLAEWWTRWFAGTLTEFGLKEAWLPNEVVATIILLLLPLCVLLLGGPKCHTKRERVVSAVGVSIIAAALLVVPLGKFISLESPQSLELYSRLASSWRYVATIGMVLGLIDVYRMHTSSRHSSKKH